MSEKQENADGIRVSVVIPCRNEESYVEQCVNSVLNSDYPQELLEILVCDGQSDDRTQQIVKDISSKNSNVHLLINEKQTTQHALNLGIDHAKGNIIAILGAHSSIDSEYIRASVHSLVQDDSLGCVGGVLNNRYSDRLSQAIAQAMSVPFGVGSAHFRTGAKAGFVDTVAFGVYKKEVFNKVGKFDLNLAKNQDDEFNYRVKKAGYEILLNPDIHADYLVRAGFGQLWRQYFQYGYWKVYVNKMHKTITTLRQLMPLLLVVFFLVLIPLSFYDPIFLRFLILGVAIYMIGALVSAVTQTVHPVQLIRIISSFVILHFSYGFGYLLGIVNFIVLRRK